MRIKHQLFLSLLGANALLILMMFALSSWFFNRGFLNYINQIETRRLTPVIATLAQEFAQRGSWDWLENDKRQWRRLLDQNRPPPRGGRKPRPSAENDARPNRNKLPMVDPRLLLADDSRRILIGGKGSSAQIQWKAIKIEDTPVGYLGYRPLKRVSEGFDQIFASQQQRGLVLAAVLMTLLSAVVSILLSSRLVKPILAIDQTLGKLSDGQYQHRLTLTRNDELGDLAKKVNLLGRTLEQNLSARQQWIAEISHELRTPIAVLQGEIEALQDGVRNLDSAALGSLHTEALRLGDLINDLHDLNLSNLGALSYSMQTIDARQLIDQCVASHSIECAEKMLSVHVSHNTSTADQDWRLTGDKKRLAQLFHNLMQNSIRHTDEGGAVAITLSSDSNRNGDALLIDWSDSAPGVSDAQLPKLFDPLFRTEESRNRALGGSGLGLAIVEKIVQAHQGSIKAMHAESGGLHVRIQLPRELT